MPNSEGSKRRILAATLISTLLVSALAGANFIESGKADPMFSFIPPSIEVASPEVNKTYFVHDINLTVFMESENSCFLFRYSDVKCFLDGGLFRRQGSLNNFSISMNNLGFGRHDIRITATLTVQPNYDGGGWWHHFTGWEGDHYLDTGSINFFVENPLTVSILAMANQTFNSAAVPLNFVVEGVTSCMKYSLDRQANVTLNGNTTLTGLSNGEHNVTVYAENYDGNFVCSETVTFAIAVSEHLAIWVAVTVLSVLLGITGLLFYFKKRKK